MADPDATAARLAGLEARLAQLEQRVAVLEGGSAGAGAGASAGASAPDVSGLESRVAALEKGHGALTAEVKTFREATALSIEQLGKSIRVTHQSVGAVLSAWDKAFKDLRKWFRPLAKTLEVSYEKDASDPTGAPVQGPAYRPLDAHDATAVTMHAAALTAAREAAVAATASAASRAHAEALGQTV